MPKFQIKSPVQKPKGYRFDGVVIGHATTIPMEQLRYSVQIDASKSRAYVELIASEYDIPDEIRDELTRMVSNCDGMIHIFSEDQLELR